MAGKRMLGCAAWALCAVVSSAWAEAVTLGVGETHVFTNAADVVQADPVRLSDRAVLVKQGAGKLTLPNGVFTEQASVSVQVREGTLAFVPSAPLVAAYEEPTEIMSRAAFWVDATRNVLLRTDAASANEVVAWLDVRETGDGGAENPYRYTRAVAFTNEWLTAFPLLQPYLDKTGVYCRGYGSGCFLNWVKADGAQEEIAGLRHVFVVHGGPTARGDMLGQRGPNARPYFQRGGGERIWGDHNGENAELFASRTYLNGRAIDPHTSYYPAESLHVLEVEALGDPLAAMCFFNDRDMQLATTAGTTLPQVDGKAVNVILGTSESIYGGNRVGGEYICEAVLFTNALTAAERLSVSAWLNQKWRGTPPPAARPATTVALAAGATLDVAADEAAPALDVRGDGLVRKTGAGAATWRSVYAPHAAAPRVQVLDGLLNLGSARPLACAAGDTLVCERRPWGPELAPAEPGADKTRLVKRGSGPVTLDALPEGVEQLRVEGGELRLADPERTPDAAPSMAETPTVTFPDDGFETYRAATLAAAYADVADGQEVRGWHAVVPQTAPGAAESRVFFFDQRVGSPNGWNMLLQSPPSGVLVVKNDASAWCEVEIPSDGDYVLSFRAAPRPGYHGEQLDVMIGPDADHLVAFGDFRTSTMDWRTFTFLPRRLTAGRHQFWLKAKGTGNDRCTQFDDFRLVRAADAAEWALPNGGFELHAADFSTKYFTVDNAARVPGFTVTPCASEGAGKDEKWDNGRTTFSARGTDSHRRFNLPWNRPESETQFYMSGIGSRLETTFTPPAGTWRFRADFCQWAVSMGYSGYVVSAAVAVNGAVLALGAVTNTSFALAPHTWPGAFTVDGETPVTLTLTGGLRTPDQSFGHGLLDNLALVRAAATGANLLRAGGFESLSPWTLEVTPKPAEVTGSDRQPYDDYYRTYFGLEAFEGASCLRLVNDDAAVQAVTFPTGGLYRLSANLAARCKPGTLNFANGLNPLAFFCARGGVTNWLGCTDGAATTNFHEYAFLVRIPEAGGTYDVGFRGRCAWGGEGTPTVDRTTLVDAVQLYRVETTRPLDLPETLEIDVADGAQLTLDFDGTNKIRRLTIAGRSCTGFVSLADRPDLLGTLAGRGTFLIRPRGTVLLLR